MNTKSKELKVKEDLKDNYIYHILRDLREMNGLKLKPEHKSVLFVLESRGKHIYPSHETLAEDSGMGVTKLKEVLNELRDHEVIDWVIGKKGTCNRYKLNRSQMANLWHEIQLEEALAMSSKWSTFHPEWD